MVASHWCVHEVYIFCTDFIEVLQLQVSLHCLCENEPDFNFHDAQNDSSHLITHENNKNTTNLKIWLKPICKQAMLHFCYNSISEVWPHHHHYLSTRNEHTKIVKTNKH